MIQQKVAVVGLGYVGCVTAACLASVGNRVVGVDRDELKVRAVNSGEAPFYEPGLEQLVRQGVASQRLRATCSLPEALQDSAIALICVGRHRREVATCNWSSSNVSSPRSLTH